MSGVNGPRSARVLSCAIAHRRCTRRCSHPMIFWLWRLAVLLVVSGRSSRPGWAARRERLRRRSESAWIVSRRSAEKWEETHARTQEYEDRLLDPTNEMKAMGVALSPRLASLEGLTVGIITNAKEGTKGYFTHLERILREELGAADVVWRREVQLQRTSGRAHRPGTHQLACGVRRCRRLRELLVMQSA